jgi:hypothetical protein
MMISCRVTGAYTADEMPSSKPLIARVLSVPAPTLLFKNSWNAEDCLRGGMRLDLVEL